MSAAQGRPVPAVRTIGYVILGLAWTIVFLAISALFVFIATQIAVGNVGPFGGNPVGGFIVATLLLGAIAGYIFVLTPFTTVTQALIGFALARASVGGKPDDLPLAYNKGRRIPFFEPEEPTSFTRRLVAIGRIGKAPSLSILIGAYLVGVAMFFTAFWKGWPLTDAAPTIICAIASVVIAAIGLVLVVRGVLRHPTYNFDAFPLSS